MEICLKLPTVYIGASEIFCLLKFLLHNCFRNRPSGISLPDRFIARENTKLNEKLDTNLCEPSTKCCSMNKRSLASALLSFHYRVQSNLSECRFHIIFEIPRNEVACEPDPEYILLLKRKK